ncbi:MAG TPA: hypothetical protein VJN21_12070 [Candidatus Acidoferrales bacterium]|nr:hypothetical protein [Candidatus Acidoferrales bacterium]
MTRPDGKALRRSKRLKLVIPVEVSSHEGEKVSFREATEMLSVNAHGGLLKLAASVQKGQTLRVVNRRTSQQQDCRVVSVGSQMGGKSAVGIEFVSAATNFWAISFPPLVPRDTVESRN